MFFSLGTYKVEAAGLTDINLVNLVGDNVSFDGFDSDIKQIFSDNIFINVKDYGAIGNGVTDDTTAIQRAINAVPIGTRAVLVCPRGMYKITASIIINNRMLSVFGYGSTLVLYNSGSLQVRSDDVVVSGLTFEQDSNVPKTATLFALDIFNVRNVTVEDCTFRNLNYAAIGIKSDTSGSSRDIRVHGCHFINNAPGDILLRGYDAVHLVSRVTVSECTFDAPTNPVGAGGNVQVRAIHVISYTTDVSIQGCHITGIAEYADGAYNKGYRDAIMIGNSSMTGRPERVTISGCTITGMADDGVGISGAVHVMIVGCDIFGSQVTSGVYVPGDRSWINDQVSVIGCHIHNHALAGIFLKDTLNYTVSDNVIHNCLNGVNINGDTSTVDKGTISGNVVYTVSKIPFYIDAGSFVLIGNKARGYGDMASDKVADKVGVYCSTSLGGSVIANNLFEDGIHGILYNGAPNRFTVTGNVGKNLSGYGHYFISFSGDYYVIADNILSGATGDFIGEPTADATKVYKDNL